MVRFRSRTIGATLAVGALVALPGVASANPATAVETVAAHTDRADVALTRATALFAAGKDTKAVAAFSRSRAETAAAVAAAAKLVHTAKTGAERAAAAKALRLVATQQAEQIPITVKLLAPAGPAAENAIAKAALADTTGRDKAIGVLNALLAKGMPDGAKAGIARALVALSTDRQDEVKVETDAAASPEVSPAAVATLVKSIDAGLKGQARAVAILTTLKAQLPAAATKGIDHAIAAIAREQKGAATALAAASPDLPAPVRESVAEIVADATDQAAAIRESHPTAPVQGQGGAPTPPAGPPSSTPAAGGRP